MNRNPTILSAAVCLCTSLAADSSATAGAAHADPALYGNLPTLEEVALSPDGSKVAFIRTNGDGRDMLVRSFGEEHVSRGAHVGNTKLRGIEWLDDDNMLITASSTSPPPMGFTGVDQEWFQLVTYQLSTNKLAGLSFDVYGEQTFNVIIGSSSVRAVGGKTMLFVPGLYVTGETLPALFKYSVPDRRMSLIAKSTVDNTQWLVDESGQIAARFVYRDEKKEWVLETRKDDHLAVTARGIEAIDYPEMLGFNVSGDSILFQFNENGESMWKPLLLKSGSWGEPLDRRAAFRRTITDRKTGRIIGGVRSIDDSHYVFFDAELQAHWNAVLRAFPGERVDLESHSDDFTKMVVRVFGLKDGYVFSMFDWYTHEATVLGQVYKGVTPAEVRPVSYPAADGMIIHGYLTLPPGAGEKNLPLIVMPHGGPASADRLQFDWWAQAVAAQGYAVLQPNYRGSNVDNDLLQAGYGQWGRKMQTDLSDGVRYLAGKGIIDPARVCIVGASYGGYAALAGVTLDPGVYRCAVSVAGVSDLKRMLKWTNERNDHSDNLSQRYWDRFMGATSPNDPSLKAISPIEHVSAVTAPVLLIHGKDDTVVAYEQSDVMADALKHAGKSVQFVTLKHEDHWLSRSATRLQMLEVSIDFLKKNNPAD